MHPLATGDASTRHWKAATLAGNGGHPAAPYKELEAICCDLSAFPGCNFFRVEVRGIADERILIGGSKDVLGCQHGR